MATVPPTLPPRPAATTQQPSEFDEANAEADPPPAYEARPTSAAEQTLEYGPSRPFQPPPHAPPPTLAPQHTNASSNGSTLPPPSFPFWNGASLTPQQTGFSEGPSVHHHNTGYAAPQGPPPPQQNYGAPYQPPYQSPLATGTSSHSSSASYAPPPHHPPPPTSPTQYSPPPTSPNTFHSPPPPAPTPQTYSPTTSPTSGQPLLNQGRLLVYPAGKSACTKCSNTGYKPYPNGNGDDPGHPCRKDWDKYGKPFTGALALTAQNPPPNYQRPLRAPRPPPPPPRPMQNGGGYGGGPPRVQQIPSNVPIRMSYNPPPPGPNVLVLRPGDPRMVLLRPPLFRQLLPRAPLFRPPPLPTTSSSRLFPRSRLLNTPSAPLTPPPLPSFATPPRPLRILPQVIFFLSFTTGSFLLAAHYTNTDTTLRQHESHSSNSAWWPRLSTHPPGLDPELASYRLRSTILSIRSLISSTSASLFGRLPVVLGRNWVEMSEERRTQWGIVGVTGVVFVLWNLPMVGVQRFARKWLWHDPLSGRWVTMLSSTFAHKSLPHIAFNSIALLSIGSAASTYLDRNDNLLPRSTSRYEYLAFFVGAGLFSALTSHLYSIRVLARRLGGSSASRSILRTRILPSLGSSGAIYATLLLTTLAFPTASVSLIFLPFIPLPIGGAVASMVALDLIGLVRGWKMFDHAAHLGGAAFGAIYWSVGHGWFEVVREWLMGAEGDGEKEERRVEERRAVRG